MNPIEIEKGLKDSSLYQGIIRFSRNRTDAYVTSEDLDFDIYIGGFSDRNRALHGDLVAVELLDVDTVWELRKERELKKLEMKKKYNNDDEVECQIKPDSQLEGEPTENDEDDKDEEDRKPAYCGHVVGILLRPPHTTYSG
jgi:protein SSD1